MRTNRYFAILLALGTTGSVSAQESQSGALTYSNRSDCSSITEQNKLNPYAYLFRERCEQSITRLNQTMARLRGQPQPSRKVLSVPMHGSEEAKRLGVACMSGLVMLRLENGWQQALDADHRYYTCRDK